MSYYQPQQYANTYLNPNPQQFNPNLYLNPNPQQFNPNTYLNPNQEQDNSNPPTGGKGNLLIGIILLAFLSYYIVTTFFKKDEKLTESKIKKDGKLTDSTIKKDEELTESEIKKDGKLTDSTIKKDGKLTDSTIKKDGKLTDSTIKKDEELTESEIKTYWKNSTGCTQELTIDLLKNNLNTSFELLLNLETADAVKEKFKKYYAEELKNTNDTNLIKQCYGEEGFLVIKSNRNQNKLYSGTEINNSNGTIGVVLLEKNGWRAVFTKEGNLVIWGPQYEHWSTGLSGQSGTKLRLQRDGNLVIYNEVDVPKWSSGTNGKGPLYLEILDEGFLMLKKSNEDIEKVLYPSSNRTHLDFYIKSSEKWGYVNSNSTTNCKKNWFYLNKDGSKIDGPHTSVLINPDDNNSIWCPTKDNTIGLRERKPISVNSIHGVDKIIHIVLLNYRGKRYYIEPHVFKDIIDNIYIGAGYPTPGCTADKTLPVNAWVANFHFDRLRLSSAYMQDIFNNETGLRQPYLFNGDDGATHKKNDLYLGCTKFHNLYDNDRLTIERKLLADDGFKPFSDDINNANNWIRRDFGRGYYDSYWRVYYRTVNDYVNYLNNYK